MNGICSVAVILRRVLLRMTARTVILSAAKDLSFPVDAGFFVAALLRMTGVLNDPDKPQFTDNIYSTLK